MNLTNWKKNISIFQLNSVFNWYQGFIGVWVLIWTKYLSFTQVGFIMSAGLLMSVFLDLPTGALADIIGRKKVILIGRILNIFAYFLFAVANNFWLFFIAEILYQSNWTFESGAQSALLYDSLKENKRENEFYKKTETDTFFYCTLMMVMGVLLEVFYTNMIFIYHMWHVL